MGGGGEGDLLREGRTDPRREAGVVCGDIVAAAAEGGVEPPGGRGEGAVERRGNAPPLPRRMFLREGGRGDEQDDKERWAGRDHRVSWRGVETTTRAPSRRYILAPFASNRKR